MKKNALIMAARLSVANPSQNSRSIQEKVKRKTGVKIDTRTIAGLQRGERYRIGKVIASLV